VESPFCTFSQLSLDETLLRAFGRMKFKVRIMLSRRWVSDWKNRQGISIGWSSMQWYNNQAIIGRNTVTVPSRAPKDAPDSCVKGAACPILVLEVVKQQKIVLLWLTKTSKFEKSASRSMLPNRNTQPKQIVIKKREG
jgi:hypothetical protein